MCDRYTYSPSTKRWPIKLFSWILDVAANNAKILYQKNSLATEEVSNEGTRRIFLENLCKQLMEEHMMRYFRDFLSENNQTFF
jgi:hypothetical protein